MASTAAKQKAERGPISATADEHSALVALNRLLSESAEGLRLVGPDGEGIEVPDSALRAMRRTIDPLSRDLVISVVIMDKQLTTQEAADLLNVSRPYLIQLLEDGAIPYTKVGSHRRIQFEDLMVFKQPWDAERHAALNELTRLNEELGLYERELRDAPPIEALLAFADHDGDPPHQP